MMNAIERKILSSLQGRRRGRPFPPCPRGAERIGLARWRRMMTWSRSSPDPSFVSSFPRWWSWRESGRKESLILAMSMMRSFAKFSTGKRASFLGANALASGMVASSPCSPRLAGVCLARLKNRFFNDQLDLSDLWFAVPFTGFL
jgi:hypothetical protein